MMFAPGLIAEWCRLQASEERRRARRIEIILRVAALAVLLSLLFTTGD